jgi:hypothetical protein
MEAQVTAVTVRGGALSSCSYLFRIWVLDLLSESNRL